MAGEIQALFNHYQQKYPLYTREAIIELMFERHEITKAEREQLKQGSLFANGYFSENNIKTSNYIEIFGGNFNKDNKPTTKFNRKIEPSFQADNQGDCWLLADINALNMKEWGRKAIHDAIIPDEDGSSGVTIKFKGSPLAQKEFHFTPRQIENARQSGLYSSGDDDMIAFELATEETFREMERQGLAKRVVNNYDDYGSYLWSVEMGEYEQYPISELLGIKTQRIYVDSMFAQKSGNEDTNKLFNWITKYNNDISIVLAFTDSSKADTGNAVHGGHAYSIKEFNLGKNVIVIDPHYSDKEINVPWDDFVKVSRSMIFSFKTPNIKKQFEKILPTNYKENLKNFEEADAKRWEKVWDDAIAQQDSLKQEKQKQIELTEAKQKQEEFERLENIKKEKAENTKIILEKIKKAKNENNFNYIDKYTFIENYNVLEILDQYPELILWLDKQKSGWGNGKDKRLLIRPIIISLAEEAKEKNIDSKIINNFKNKCNKELDATFYTDEKVIQSEVEKMVKLIKSKS